MKANFNPYLCIFLLFSSLIVACDSNRIYEDYNDFEDAYWHQDSIQTFTFPIADKKKAYTIYATIRNTSSYPFYNLYFQYEIKDSEDQIVIEELKEVKLFDAKTGEPYGSGLGDIFDHSFILQEQLTFPDTGSYQLSMTQFMRRDTLPFILSAGARVERYEP